MPAIEFPPLIYVDIKRAPLSKLIPGWGLPGRPQRWYWVAKSADNQRKLARATERYTNREDCVHAAWLLFSSSTTVYQREAEQGNVALRMAAG